MSGPYRSFGRWWPGALTILAAVAAALVPTPASTIERWYSLGIYPPIERLLTSATNLVPLAVLDVLIVLAAGWLIRLSVVAVKRTRARRSVAPLGAALYAVVIAAAAGYLVFLGLWGLNYRRVPMRDRLAVTSGSVDADRVLTLGLEAVTQLNSLHGDAHRLGWPVEVWRSTTLTSSAATVLRELTGLPAAVPGRLKASMLGPYFRWTGVDGMVNPFGLDIIGNPDLLPFERPFVAAHEWAHLAGFADEAEASFVGFLTCIRSSLPDQYSGWLYLYWQIAGETDSASRARLWEAMDEGPRADVEAVIARLRRGQLPRLRAASWLVYDQYLRANRVESGVRSYGDVVNLLVRARFEPGWVPVRKGSAADDVSGGGAPEPVTQGQANPLLR